MEKARNISKSMISYLKRVREQKEFLLKETQQYERSKRHLANMMGLEEQEMTQTDVDEAVKYLFPSGLFDKRAHPMLKHPDLIFKAVKDAQFDEEGRPHHYLFYTSQPNYHESMAKIVDSLDKLDKHEDKKLAQGYLDPPAESQYIMIGRRWLLQQELSDKLLEKINEHQYNYFLRSANALIDHPYSVEAKEFIEEYTKELSGTTLNVSLPELLKDENGRTYAEMITKKREHRVKTRVTFGGSGLIDIENKDILYFESPINRQNVYFPIQMSRMQDKIDIHSRIVVQPVTFGEASVSGAIREAVSKSIAAYVDEETRERMRLAGLLTTDVRVKERKKYGQEGARRKFTWKKR